MSIKTGAITGAIVGAGVAVVLLSLDHIRPFSPDTNAFIEKLTFKVCPLYVLGFMNVVTTMASVVVLTILGNAVLYGAVFAGVAGILAVLKRPAAV
jgi:hypothetical protein